MVTTPESPFEDNGVRWSGTARIAGVSHVHLPEQPPAGPNTPAEITRMVLHATLGPLEKQMALRTLRETLDLKKGEFLHLDKVESLVIRPEWGLVAPTALEMKLYSLKNPDPLPKVKLPADWTPDLDKRDDVIAQIAHARPDLGPVLSYCGPEFTAIKDDLKIFFMARALGKPAEIFHTTDHALSIYEAVKAFGADKGHDFSATKMVGEVYTLAYDMAYQEFLSDFFGKKLHHGRDEGEIYERLKTSFDVMIEELNAKLLALGKTEDKGSGRVGGSGG
jgi:hypothetical protein